MADKLFEDDELVVKRFSCDCYHPTHIMDIALELADEGKRVVQCSLDLYMSGSAPLKTRIKAALDMLRGKDIALADFLISPRDIPEIIAVLEKAKCHTE